ncbi:COX15/CtaA family protein [Flavobacteriaceae bacterium]|nr:COX15/CtaA family protein [Flavobacteriaceae bacterium]MDC0496967.1 COX15/CtaA family protein [Flavobacteriaceae bacterium]
MNKRFNQLTKISLVLIYLVIIAGAIVRMTGSGMGCPDWPKCFGYLIPPTEPSQLMFKSFHDYNKGEMILLSSENFYTAIKDFKSEELINLNNWNLFEKHDYVVYDPVHTWIEYINRLIGALAGIPILFFTLISIYHWKDYKYLTIVSILTVFGMGFQAWLGKTVVDSNLAPYKITVHMLMALVIVALILVLIVQTKKVNKLDNQLFKNLVIFSIILTLVQVAIGTQVREFVDEQVKLIGYDKSNWLTGVPLKFYVHRSFSILVLLVNLYLFYLNKKLSLGYNKVNYVIFFIGVEIATGILMYYYDFPILSQPIHLVIATIIFGLQFYILLEYLIRNKLIRKIEIE